MSLPELERSYELVTNLWYPTTGVGYTDRRILTYSIFWHLTNFTNSPWTMVASSNGSTAGWPGPGWSSYLSVVSGTNRSWVVLENVFGAQILLSKTTTQYNMDIWFSPDGSFSGGATNAEPTGNATEIATSYDFWSGTGGNNIRLSFIHAIDGTFDIFLPLLTYNGVCGWSPVLFAKLEDTPPEWELPYLAYCGVQAYTTLHPAQEDGYGDNWQEDERWFGFKAAGGVTPFAGKLTSEVWDNQLPNTAINSPNEISGKWQLLPLAFCGGADAYGIQGRLPDIYAVSGQLVTGDSIEEDPNTPAWQWMTVGHYALPWNGSPMITTV